MGYRTRYGGTGLSAAQIIGLPRRMRSGMYYAPWLFSADSTLAITQNTEVAVPLLIGANCTLDRIGLEVTTAAASNVVRLGIRYDDGTYPGAVLLDAGTIDATATTGFKEINISQAITAGLWWVTATLQGGTGAAVRIKNVNTLIGQTVTSTSNSCGFSQTGVTGALGSFTSTPASAAGGPKILVRVA